jgi:hypothetical protein
MEQRNRSTVGRREFLRVLGTTAAAATATRLSSDARAVDTEQNKHKARYRESDHIRTYYRVNRYPR